MVNSPSANTGRALRFAAAWLLLGAGCCLACHSGASESSPNAASPADTATSGTSAPPVEPDKPREDLAERFESACGVPLPEPFRAPSSDPEWSRLYEEKLREEALAQTPGLRLHFVTCHARACLACYDAASAPGKLVDWNAHSDQGACAPGSEDCSVLFASFTRHHADFLENAPYHAPSLGPLPADPCMVSSSCRHMAEKFPYIAREATAVVIDGDARCFGDPVAACECAKKHDIHPNNCDSPYGY